MILENLLMSIIVGIITFMIGETVYICLFYDKESEFYEFFIGNLPIIALSYLFGMITFELMKLPIEDILLGLKMFGVMAGLGLLILGIKYGIFIMLKTFRK
jgi:hypothetical protein